jgi:hypothetical protein
MEVNAKLILTLDGAILRQFPVDRAAISIGRKHGNEVQLNDITVSGRHALITVVRGKVFVEDLGSTNGTLVNGGPIRKVFLKHGDVIQVGAHQLTFFDSEAQYQETMFIKADLARTVILPEVQRGTDPVKGQPLAGTRILNGPLANIVWEMRKPFNTVGYKGIMMAVIARGVNGYTVSDVRSMDSKRASDAPVVNGEQVGKLPRLLKEHDILEIAGFRMEFFYIR